MRPRAAQLEARTDAATATNPYVFLVGCPRSGTTLLQRMVDAHPAIAIPQETHWIAKWLEQGIGVTGDGRLAPDVVDRLLGDRRFARLGIGREQLERMAEESGGSWSALNRAIFDAYARERGKPLAGDKTPGYVRSIPTLHRLFPAARFVHLIRDGRDVCLSVVNWKRNRAKLESRFTTWAEDPVSTAALWWEWHVASGIEAGRALPAGLYREVRYESLVADPEPECASLCEFLGLPYDDAMVRFHEGRTRLDPGLDAKHAWLPPTRGLRDWRSDMSADEAERAEAAAGDLLAELGYELASVPGPDAVRRARALREAFARDVPDSLPRRW